MKTSIATVAIAGDLGEKLSAIANAGFDGIEIFEADFVAFHGSPADAGEMVRDHGLTIDLFQPFRDFEGLPEPLRGKAFDRIERKFDLMGELGTDLLLVSCSSHPEAQGGLDRLAGDFAELGERAAKRGLRVGYEARAWGKYIADYRDAWNVVRHADSAAVGLVLDSFHTLARGSDLIPLKSIPGDRIFHVQLADAPDIEMDLEYRSRHFRTMPGEGDLPLLDFMKALAVTGYNGPLSLEIFNNSFRSGSPRAIALDGQRSLIYLMNRLHEATRKTAIDVICMPPRVPVAGIEFVEFTASEKEAEALGRMLSSLGFLPVGRHISKSVTLWRQSDINLVVNTDKEGFAHSAYVMHGMSVCDMGLMVEDAAAAVERARMLRASLFSQRRGKGELDIPAVRGVGGSVLHLLDRKTELAKVWDTEFVSMEDAVGNAKPCGLTHIDHVGQVMNDEEMQSWTLFYESIFAVEKTEIVDVADPSGLVRSRAVQGGDGAFRLTMNGVATHRTLAGRFIADSSGSPVQHLAFATDDMITARARLGENGFEVLPIPENYYSDLASRFDLTSEYLEQLRKGDILYDEDGNGVFLQLYSRPFADGLFFEIVERRGAYHGFGGSNAPYRTAALKRLSRPSGIP